MESNLSINRPQAYKHIHIHNAVHHYYKFSVKKNWNIEKNFIHIDLVAKLDLKLWIQILFPNCSAWSTEIGKNKRRTEFFIIIIYDGQNWCLVKNWIFFCSKCFWFKCKNDDQDRSLARFESQSFLAYLKT